MRKVIALLEVDDDKAIDMDLGTLDYLQKVSRVLQEDGVEFLSTRILDEDDPDDWQAIAYTEEIFE